MSAGDPSAAARPADWNAGPFTPGTGILLALVGVVAFCALAVLGAYAPDLKVGDNGRGHALSRSAIGYAGLVEALKLSGEPVLVSRGPLPPGAKGLVVVTNDFPTTIGKPLNIRFDRRPVLIVLAKWVAAPDPGHRGWVRRIGLIPAGALPPGDDMTEAKVAYRQGVSRPVLHGVAAPFAGRILSEGPVERFQTITTKDWIPILTDERGGVVLARERAAPIYRLSDPDLLDTQGLKTYDTLASALAMVDGLKGGDGPVIFDVTLNGFGRERGLLRLMFEPPLLAVTLCLAAAAALAGFQAACRFGPTRHAPRAFALGKQALVDNSAALIHLAGREHRMGGRYAALTRDIVAKAVGVPHDLTAEEQAALLDRIGAQRGVDEPLGVLSTLARTAPDRARLTSAAQRLYRWRLEMTRERG